VTTVKDTVIVLLTFLDDPLPLGLELLRGIAHADNPGINLPAQPISKSH
jgi:hypothetical protein